MSKYSDHKKPQINLKDYLPEVYRSDINTTMSDMVLDRHFTKDDTVRVTGYVGTGNPTAVVKRQIREAAIDSHNQAHRQAFQLAPTMYNKIGTVESALSYQNFLTQLELQGVDINRLPLWGSSLEFNWAPPINIDMLVNYQDYFWNGSNISDAPQYFSIENVCNKASDKVLAYQSLMQQRGIHLPIVSIDFDNNTFVLQDKWDNIFSVDFAFYTSLSNTINLSDKFWKTDAVTYNSATNKTTIKVEQPIAPTIAPKKPNTGDWWYDSTAKQLFFWNGDQWTEYVEAFIAQIIIPALFTITHSSFIDNTFSISGKQDDLFVPGFVFLTKDSSNVNIQNKFWTTLSSTYDDVKNLTIIHTEEPLAVNSNTPPTPTFVGEWWYQPVTKILHAWDGSQWVATTKAIIANISLSELLLVFQTQLNCKCRNERGWDIGLWDDNSIGNVAWNTELLASISFPTESEWIAHNENNPAMMSDGAIFPFVLWYDTTYDVLKQYGDRTQSIPSGPLYHPTWNIVARGFSNILTMTSARENWDESTDCDLQELNQWSIQNKWQHKTAINTYANVKRAQIPILEYDSNLELNAWTKIEYDWKYRNKDLMPFESTTHVPNRFELEPIKGYNVDARDGNWYIYLFDRFSTVNANVDLTDIFVPGYKFRLVDDLGLSRVFTVDHSEFNNMSTSTLPNVVGDHFVTVVKIRESVFDAPLIGGGINKLRLVPIVTSLGDIWEGYHTHWVMDPLSKRTSAVQPQTVNIFRQRDIDLVGITESVKGNEIYENFLPQVSNITRGTTYQELTINIPNVHTIQLISQLKYDSSNVNPYALPDSNELRVYINNVRQYGTYIETVESIYVNYTTVGIKTNSVSNIEQVTGIIFNPEVVLAIGDVVRIEVGPASLDDMGRYNVPVRTIEDDVEFAKQVIAGTQPVYKSLTKFELNEQNKISVNQYPLFNVYDLMTGDVVYASPIITFKEDQLAPINGAIQRRIVITNNGIEYEFDQHLLDSTTGQLYGYRNKTLQVADRYWYSQLTSKILHWNGFAWSDKVVVTTSTGLAIRKILKQSTDPTELWNIDQALWFNESTRKLYRRNKAAQSWIEITGVVTNDADPSLRSIWRRGLNNENYVPQYVDKDRNPIAVGSLNGDWEIVKQWIYNSEHQNRTTLKLSQLSTHFLSIIKNQPITLGLISGGVYSKDQVEYNYGVGGTIKEFNGAFDTLISAVNVTNTTPIGVLEYAASEYAANIRFIRDIFNRAIIDLFGNYVVEGLQSFQSHVNESIIRLYENNDFVAKIYGDTTAYDPDTDTGIRNWIATAPMFGLSPAHKPHLLDDGIFTQIIHHDGHRTNVNYSLAEEDVIARKIIAISDTRITGSKLGALGVGSPPATEQDFITFFGGEEVRSGVFWYKTGAPRHFYRFELYTVGPMHPSFYYNGDEILDGTLYYNTITHCAYSKVGLTWVAATTPGSYDISPIWTEINFQSLLGQLYLEIENRLYARCVDVLPVYDYTTLTPNVSEEAVYHKNYKKRFEEYVVNYSVPTPYVNTQYRQIDAFSWNYFTSIILTPPHSGTAPVGSACWQSLYTNWFGTPYPHLEPWVLQGFTNKPDWWDDEYLETNGSRRWKFNYNPSGLSLGTGMWENIRTGQVPAGRTYPSGIISSGNSVNDNQPLRTYSYFCVNITNSTITGGYVADQLLPPYYATNDAHVRSLFTNMNQVIVPDADYIFGDGSVIEWQWKVSAQYPYENPIIAYIMQPVRFLRASFGPRYTFVDGLEVDTLFNKVYSHKDTLFHGDMYGINGTYLAKGLNQWYINYNRFTGFDTSYDFRELWVGWTPLLTYQFNSIIDTNTLDIANKRFDLIKQDYNVALINNGAFRELWVEAFNISIISIPPAIIQYNNQNKWKLELTSLASIAREIYYYDVKAYPFIVDQIANECFAYRYLINAVDAAADRLYVSGNETDVFVFDTAITVSNSTVLNGTYTVLSSVYEPSVDRTRINLLENLTGSIGDGVISISEFALPWNTGDMIVLNSDKILPAPLVPNTPYYIIKTGTQSFKLAETFNEAHTLTAIDITNKGVGVHSVAEIVSSFNVMGGESHSKETWYHYALDKSKILMLASPQVLNGMQNLINIIDGYAEYQHDAGVIYNTADSNDFDPHTGRLINWSLELERFIDWAYGLRRARMSLSDRYEFSANTSDNTLTATDLIPFWPNGTAVQVSTTGTLPSPLYAGETYYVVATTVPGVIKLSASQDITYTAFHIDLLSQGSGHIYLSMKDKLRTYPSFEINPSRNNIWLDTPLGVLSDVIQGPYTDIRVRQTIFDQYGRPLEADKLLVHRQDTRNRIATMPQLKNDIDPFYTDDPYNYIHLGGGHFFLEGYEHFLLFNQMTASGVLLYDSFLGLYSTRFEMDFFKKPEHTLRPTLGGFYLKGKEFARNIEGSASDLQNFYDTYAGSEDSSNIKLVRSLLGYKGRTNYMEMLNVNSKSQFVFYRGMLHAKGSVSSILAYINSRRFVDAKIDDFWAVKIAEFGDNRIKVYPELLLFTDDGVVDDVRFEFVGLEDDPTNPDIQYAVDFKGFKLVSFADDSRWNNFPEQRARIKQPLFLDADLSNVDRIFVAPTSPPVVQSTEFEYWYNTLDNTLRIWSGKDWLTRVENKIKIVGNSVYWRHNEPCDDIRVVRRDANMTSATVPILNAYSYTNTSNTPNMITVSGDLTSSIYVGTVVTISHDTLNNGNYEVSSVSYDKIQHITIILVTTNIAINSTNGSLTYINFDFNLYNTVPLHSFESSTSSYEKINAEVVRIDMSAFFDIIHIYSVRPSLRKISPARLVDKKSDAIIDQVSLWHPAYGMHSYKALFNIDLSSKTDPAKYSHAVCADDVSGHFWDFTEVGTKWFDTSTLGYIPYYDDKVFPDINNRLYQWGSLAEFSNPKVYQWVRSPVVPSEWDKLALKQQGNITIPQGEKITGIARKQLFKQVREIVDGSVTFGSQKITVTIPTLAVQDGQSVKFSATSKLPDELIDVMFTVNEASKTLPQTFVLTDPNTKTPVVLETVTKSPVTVENVGTEEKPIQVFQSDAGLLTPGDAIAIGTITQGELPTGASTESIASASYQDIMFDVPKKASELTGLAKDVLAAGGYNDVKLSVPKYPGDWSGLYTEIPPTAGFQEVVNVPDNETGLNPSTSFTVSVIIDGIHNMSVNIPGSTAQNITNFVAYLNNGFSQYAYVELKGGNLRITSKTLGPTSSVLITNASAFKSLASKVSTSIASDLISTKRFVDNVSDYTVRSEAGSANISQVLSIGYAQDLILDQIYNTNRHYVDKYTATSHYTFCTVSAPVKGTGVPDKTYSANITVNGTLKPVSFLGSQAKTYGEMIAQINTDLGSSAIAKLEPENSRIRISSVTTGPASTCVIQDINLFSSLSQVATPLATVGGNIESFTSLDTSIYAGVANTLSLLDIKANLMSFLSVEIDTPKPGNDFTQTTYTADIKIDGTSHPISILGGSHQTFEALLASLSALLTTKATVGFNDGNIRIQSTTLGPDSTVEIVDGNLFKNCSNYEFINVLSSVDVPVTNLPGFSTSLTPIGHEYTVVDVQDVEGTDKQTFRVVSKDGGVPILPTNFGVGDLKMTTTTKAVKVLTDFDNSPWVKQVVARHRIIGVWLSTASVVEPVLHWKASTVGDTWYPGDKVEIYQNGKLVWSGGVVVYNSISSEYEVATVGSGLVVHPQDYIDIFRPLHNPTAEELEFDPITADDEVSLVRWKEDYEYSQTVVAVDAGGTSTINYYFWVEQSTTKNNDSSSMSILEINRYIIDMPDPYFIVQKPLDSSIRATAFGYDQQDYGILWEMQEPSMDMMDAPPIMYREAIIRNVANYITDNDRFMVQFTRDLSLRDDLTTRQSQMNLKDKHEEWLMFREKQSNSVAKFLWDKLTEALTGMSLLDGTAVPSLDRVLYDDNYGTETRYGLEEGQAFVNRSLGLKTLLNYLTDPTRQFAPLDINDFFARNDFTTPLGIQKAMIEIYNNFGTEHINGIWFEILQDALSTKAKYNGLMKTSWVALHGIRVLEVSGLFDE